MRLLKILLCLCVPALILINVARFGFFGEGNFAGFSYLHEAIQSFPGFTMILQLVETMGDRLSNLTAFDYDNGWLAVKDILEYIGCLYALLPCIAIDLLADIIWIITFIFGRVPVAII